MPATFRAFLFAAIAACALIAWSDETHTLPFYIDDALTPTWMDKASDTASIHRISSFRLIDQAGLPFTADSLEGRVHVANFFFSSCNDICPLTRRQLKEVARTFADDNRVLITSYSVTPERDSVGALAQFAARNGVNHARWRLLTGDRAIMRRVSDSYLIGTGRGSDYGVDSVAHTEMIALVDQHRHIRGVYNGSLRLDMAQLVSDARLLLAER